MIDRVNRITQILKSRNSPFAPASKEQIAALTEKAIAEKIPLYKLERMSLGNSIAVIILRADKMEAYL
jgi:hypothetical protein